MKWKRKVEKVKVSINCVEFVCPKCFKYVPVIGTTLLYTKSDMLCTCDKPSEPKMLFRKKEVTL